VIAAFPATRNARLCAGVFILAFALGGCSALVPQSMALREAPPAGIPSRVELPGVPFFPQEEYQCGPAALATVLVHRKVAVTPEQLVPQVYLPERKGSLQVEMLAAARRRGMVSYALAPRLEDVLRELAAGNSVIVLQDIGIWPFENWHYAVAFGYDLETGELLLRSGERERQVLPFAVHEYVWRRSGHWSMVAVPPERIAATASEAGWLASLAALERVDARGARSGYAAFLQRWPANVEALIGLANTHYAARELSEAEAVLRRVLQRRPDSVVAQNNLAQTLSDQGRHAEALEMAERAVAGGGPFSQAARETRDLVRSRMTGRP
jgi:Tetratricopeptide repeat/Peptidase_C39 like family